METARLDNIAQPEQLEAEISPSPPPLSEAGGEDHVDHSTMASTEVLLADGTTRCLDDLGAEALLALQWEQEQAFAKQIVAAPKGSSRRSEITHQAYDTVTTILAVAQGVQDQPLAMGIHARHERMVLELLSRQRSLGLNPCLFEIGFGTGILLERVWAAGHTAAGIEVSTSLREEACRRLGPRRAARLYMGDFLKHDFSNLNPPCTMVYWNDVFEHVAPDEILDYLRRIHDILVPGGQLVTVTPNWHVRPWDVTSHLRPRRTEAAGLHLKEYTFGEVNELLRQAGFDHVAMPLFAVRSRFILLGNGLADWKQRFEPCLEYLPFRLALLLCRGFSMDCTIATKGGLTVR